MTYSDKLKDPRWQKKRLEIMSRDKFTCRFCGEKEEMLVIHHLRYTGEPWEADNNHLLTLCASCHGYEHEEKKAFSEMLDKVIAGTSTGSGTYFYLADFVTLVENNRNQSLEKTLQMFIICLNRDESFIEKIITPHCLSLMNESEKKRKLNE